jgi:hypothetical protein
MTPEERRKQANADILRRMKEGDALMSERNPFPERGTIKKDPKEIARTLDPAKP